MSRSLHGIGPALLVAAIVGLASVHRVNAGAAEGVQLQQLAEQNRRLEEQLVRQQQRIETLTARIGEIAQANAQNDQTLKMLQARDPAPNESSAPRRGEHDVRLSAEAGFAFFRSGPAGQFPNSDFRVDEAKVFLEAPVWKDTYFFAGLELVTREASDEFFHVGELYLDFENVSGHWHRDRLLSVRLGRFYQPFGEEYQVRGVMDNPLIAHSLSDIWGIDEGIEAYGEFAKFSYAVAVQNGGHKTLHDYDSDKAFMGRLSYDPLPWLHLSGSAMRTGDLNVVGDGMSETWISNGFFRALGNPATTTTFRANLIEGDVTARWKSGHIHGVWGTADFDDNDRTADNSRRIDYHSVEAVQKFSGGFYGALRWSRVHDAQGYPLVGAGDFGRYLFRSAFTEELHRLSLGVGYQIAPPLIWKAAYDREGGKLINGERRNQEDLLSTEIALRF